jgi:phytoene/squalene synthetase
MALQLGALRDALLDAGASTDKADKAAEELADYEKRLAGIEGKLMMLIWAVGANVAATIAVVGMIVAMNGRLGEISSQLTQIAQLLHH